MSPYLIIKGKKVTKALSGHYRNQNTVGGLRGYTSFPRLFSELSNGAKNLIVGRAARKKQLTI